MPERVVDPEGIVGDVPERLAWTIRRFMDRERVAIITEGPDATLAVAGGEKTVWTLKRAGALAVFIGDPREEFAVWEWFVAVAPDGRQVGGSAVLHLESREYPGRSLLAHRRWCLRRYGTAATEGANHG